MRTPWETSLFKYNMSGDNKTSFLEAMKMLNLNIISYREFLKDTGNGTKIKKLDLRTYGDINNKTETKLLSESNSGEIAEMVWNWLQEIPNELKANNLNTDMTKELVGWNIVCDHRTTGHSIVISPETL